MIQSFFLAISFLGKGGGGIREKVPKQEGDFCEKKIWGSGGGGLLGKRSLNKNVISRQQTGAEHNHGEDKVTVSKTLGRSVVGSHLYYSQV